MSCESVEHTNLSRKGTRLLLGMIALPALLFGFPLVLLGLLSDDDDAVAIMGIGTAILAVGVIALAGAVQGGRVALWAVVMLAFFALGIVLLKVGIGPWPVILSGGALATAILVFATITHRGDPPLEPYAPYWAGVGIASTLLAIVIVSDDPPPQFRDPFARGFDAAFASHGMQVIQHDEHAFGISGRGSYTQVETLLLVDVGWKCPDGDASCVETWLNEVSWVDLAESDGSSGLVRLELSTEHGSCSGTAGASPIFEDRMEWDWLGGDHDQVPHHWFIQLSC